MLSNAQLRLIQYLGNIIAYKIKLPMLSMITLYMLFTNKYVTYYETNQVLYKGTLYYQFMLVGLKLHAKKCSIHVLFPSCTNALLFIHNKKS